MGANRRVMLCVLLLVFVLACSLAEGSFSGSRSASNSAFLATGAEVRRRRSVHAEGHVFSLIAAASKGKSVVSFLRSLQPFLCIVCVCLYLPKAVRANESSHARHPHLSSCSITSLPSSHQLISLSFIHQCIYPYNSQDATADPAAAEGSASGVRRNRRDVGGGGRACEDEGVRVRMIYSSRSAD
jgi:hypothetical protein